MCRLARIITGFIALLFVSAVSLAEPSFQNGDAVRENADAAAAWDAAFNSENVDASWLVVMEIWNTH